MTGRPRDRLDRLSERLPGPKVLDIGGGKTVKATPDEKFDALFAAFEEGDHRLLDVVRSAEGRGRTGDPFSQLLRAAMGDDSLIPDESQDLPEEDLVEEPQRSYHDLSPAEKQDLWKNSTPEERERHRRGAGRERWERWKAERGLGE